MNFLHDICQYINTFFNTEFDLYFKIQILCVLFFSFCKQTMRQRHGKTKTCRKQRLLRNWLSEEYNIINKWISNFQFSEFLFGKLWNFLVIHYYHDSAKLGLFSNLHMPLLPFAKKGETFLSLSLQIVIH